MQSSRSLFSRLFPSAALLAIVFGALCLRVYGIDWGLPDRFHPNYSYHPDEAFTLIWARWLVEGQIISKHFIYGGTLHYTFLNAYIYFGRIFGDTIGGFNLLANSIVVGRYFLVLVALISIVMVFECGRLLYGRATGILAAAFLAVAPGHVHWAQQVRPDEIGVLLVLLTMYVGARVQAAPGVKIIRAAIVTGALFGVLVAFRFPLAVFVVMPVVALLRRMQTAPVSAPLGITAIRAGGAALVAAVGSYVIVSPHTLIYFREFLAGIEVTRRYESSVFLYAVERGPLIFQHLAMMLPQALGLGLALLALLGATVAVRRRTESDIMLLAAMLPYVLMLGVTSWVVVRYSLPLLPLCILLAARVVVEATGPAQRGPMRAGAAAIAALAFAWSLLSTMAFLKVEASTNVRDVAGAWLDRNVPDNARMLVIRSYGGDEFYEPTFPQQTARGIYVLSESGDSAALFSQNVFDYVIIGEPLYAPMERLGERHPLQQSRIFHSALRAHGFEVWREFRIPVELAGLDLTPLFASLDFTVVNPGIRVYRRARSGNATAG